MPFSVFIFIALVLGGCVATGVLTVGQGAICGFLWLLLSCHEEN